MNPFIPRKGKKLVIIDGRVSEEDVKILEEKNAYVIKTIKCEEVDDGISYHPDIVLNPVDKETLVIAPNVFDYYYEILRPMGINLIKGSELLTSSYPGDIKYNLGRLKNIAIHNFKWTDPSLLQELEKRKLEFINVPQGYTKCSLAVVGQNAAITADRIIYERLKELRCDMLLIEPGFIELPGFDYGFIGGCMGKLSEDEIIISGKLEGHPDRERIMEFVSQYNREIIFLNNDRLRDLGTIIVMGTEEEVIGC